MRCDTEMTLDLRPGIARLSEIEDRVVGTSTISSRVDPALVTEANI